MLRIYFIQFKPNSHADRVYFITSFTTASFLYHVEKRHSKRRCWNFTFVSFLYWDMSGTKCADKLLHTARNEIFTGLAHFWAVCVKLIWSNYVYIFHIVSLLNQSKHISCLLFWFVSRLISNSIFSKNSNQ